MLVPSTTTQDGKGKSPFIVAEERGQVIVHQNTVIVAARGAWNTMKETYSKSLLKKKFFGN